MKILVLGGDGFCGWPTSLKLSSEGHQVIIVDNFSRRNIDNELFCVSLTPISSLKVRLNAWQEVTDNKIGFVFLDIAKDYDKFLSLINDQQPDAIIHFAEQRAAPYSMKSSFHKRYTVDNNLNATNNVCAAIVESGLDIHLVHLGTMGVYGYNTTDMAIPEGYLKIKAETNSGDWSEMDVVYPPNAGSIYHMTKTQDALFFQFYNKNDKLKITDLHQGIVWGTETSQTKLDPRLINRFDYDGDFGTVLNRFIMQSAVGHPLTVHGTGGQTRAFININDTANCVSLAVNNPPNSNEKVRIINQMTETHRIIDLAKMISNLTGAEIDYVNNPRKELPENELDVINATFLNMGLSPIRLKDNLTSEIFDVASKYKHRVDLEKIPAVSKW